MVNQMTVNIGEKSRRGSVYVCIFVYNTDEGKGENGEDWPYVGRLCELQRKKGGWGREARPLQILAELGRRSERVQCNRYRRVLWRRIGSTSYCPGVSYISYRYMRTLLLLTLRLQIGNIKIIIIKFK